MRILLSIFSMLMLSGWNWGGADTPPVSVPFDISTKGATATLEFRIKEEKKYPFLLNIYGDLREVYSSAHTNTETLQSIELPLRLKIIKIEKDKTETIIIDEIFSNHPEPRGVVGQGSSRRVAFPRLSRGDYKAYVESLDDIEVYKHGNITFTFGITHLVAK